MKLRSTQFNFINSEDGPCNEPEERSDIMEEGEALFSFREPEAEFSPSDEVISRILDFARSCHTVPSRSLRFIDIYMN